MGFGGGYGLQYGLDEGDTTPASLALTFLNFDPAGASLNVLTDKAISVEVISDNAIDVTKTTFKINNILVYANETSFAGFTVVRTPISFGYNYEITPSKPWSYGQQVTVVAYAEDTAISTQSTWSFSIVDDPTCFIGPITATEDALLTPFTSLNFTEKLRKSLVAAVMRRPNATVAARAIYLNAHAFELAPVLNQLVATPTTAQRSVRLCHKATNLDVSNALRRKVNYIPGAIEELKGLGVPKEHIALLQDYALEDQPNTEVHLACVIVVLAKALE